MKRIDLSIRYYFFWIILYLSLVLLLPANKIVMSNYNLSSGQYHMLLLFVVLPYIGIWFAAFHGYGTIRKYSNLIRNTPEGPNFQTLSNGFTWLAWSLPIAAVSSLLQNSYANSNAGFGGASIIVNDYLALLLPLIGFILIRKSSHRLLSAAKLSINKSVASMIGAGFAVLGVAYCYLTYRHLDLSSISNTNNPYNLPNWLVLTSLTIPFLASWFIGLIAAFEIFIYSKASTGLLYRRALMLLAFGVLAVIISLVVLEYLTVVSPHRGFLSLNYQLVITYAIRIFSAIGYVLIVVGAHRLKRIEEV